MDHMILSFKIIKLSLISCKNNIKTRFILMPSPKSKAYIFDKVNLNVTVVT